MNKVDAFLEKLAGESNGIDEGALFKFAHQNETVEASTRLAIVGEELTKLAYESNDEILGECAEGLMAASQNFMTGLNKIAADNAAGAVVDMIETQDGLSKIASVLEAYAVEIQNDGFTKLAEEVIDVNNTLFDELSDLASTDESVANALAEYHS